MNKTITITLILLTMMLTACGSASNRTLSDSAAQNQSLPIQTELIVGTLKLDGTDQSITTQQASQLLPLWQVMKDLNSSDTAAQQEIDALTDQIKGTMTSKQLQAIANMKLTQQDISTIVQAQDTDSSTQQQSSSNLNQGNGGGFAPPGGDLTGMLLGGGLPAAVQSTSSSKAATAQAGGSDQIPSGLIDTLIQFLQKKAG